MEYRRQRQMCIRVSLVIVPALDVVRTEMTTEDAMRVVISGGIRLDSVFQQSGFQVPGKIRSNQ